jgi:hypothetical protein
MRKLVLSILFLALSSAVPTAARAGEPATVAAINAAAAALDDAFERQNSEDINRLVTADHLAVTPYYRAPTTAAEQIASLPELKYKQTITGEVKVVVLGPDAGMRSFTARLDGSYRGQPIPADVFITSIMVREDGVWREKFYQVTDLQR